MIIDGKSLAKEILATLKIQVQNQSRPLKLVAITIGDNPALEKFVELKRKAAEEVGVSFSTFNLPSNVLQREAQAYIAGLSRAEDVQGIFIELPIPDSLDTQALLDEIEFSKDVDVLSHLAEGLFYKFPNKILPPAVSAFKTVLEKYSIDLAEKKAAVFGQGRLIGKPISHWLESQGVEVFRIDEHTPNPGELSCQADIIVSGVGKPGLITADMVKEGAIVIDFGYGKQGTKMVGDVVFEEVAPKASLITPVPGCMGPLVIAAVLQNLVNL